MPAVLVAAPAAIAYYPRLPWEVQTAAAFDRRQVQRLLYCFALISTLDAAETNVCTVSANPSGFDHRQIALEGIVAALNKSTSRGGHKQMTFLLRSPVGCGDVIVYAQEPATLSNGDHLQVEGIFEMEHRRDGSTFRNEMQATKITTLPR